MSSVPSVFGELSPEVQKKLREEITDTLTVTGLGTFGLEPPSPDDDDDADEPTPYLLSEKQADEIWFLIVAGDSFSDVDKCNARVRELFLKAAGLTYEEYKPKVENDDGELVEDLDKKDPEDLFNEWCAKKIKKITGGGGDCMKDFEESTCGKIICGIAEDL